MSVTSPKGFAAAAAACGIKPSGEPDVALVATADGKAVPAAAVFTTNLATAAPVQVSRAHLAETAGKAAAVVLNSGNANAATGAAGRATALATCAAAADALGCASEEVLVCSTGLIGIPLARAQIVSALPKLVADRSAAGGSDAARAIMTTDTHPKEVLVRTARFSVGGMAKGAAMLAPNMATMLAVLTTDAEVDPVALRVGLAEAVECSFNTLSVDGCTSTNDTVIVLASGHAGHVEIGSLNAALAQACAELAAQMAGDAEGATKVVRVTVTGADSVEDARRAARRVAESQLVKCSWYGRDPYWGRIVSELGSAGVVFDPDTVSVAYGGVTVCRNGVGADHDAEALAAHMARRNLDVTADLGQGSAEATVLTNDLTHAYVDENMGTS